MGFAKCRVTGCPETGSQEYVLCTTELATRGVYLWFPSMWRHYAVVHGFQPQEEARRLVMSTMPNDPSLAKEFMQTRSAVPTESLKKIAVLTVERNETGYDHTQGKIDWEFIQHVDRILEGLPSSKNVQKTGIYR